MTYKHFFFFFSEREIKSQNKSGIIDKFYAIKNSLTGDFCLNIQILIFFAMVFILPMIPILMFLLSENRPSINPSVFEQLHGSKLQK